MLGWCPSLHSTSSSPAKSRWSFSDANSAPTAAAAGAGYTAGQAPALPHRHNLALRPLGLEMWALCKAAGKARQLQPASPAPPVQPLPLCRAAGCSLGAVWSRRSPMWLSHWEGLSGPCGQKVSSKLPGLYSTARAGPHCPPQRAWPHHSPWPHLSAS